MRCLPHDEDTGGFFVATFRKIAQPSAPSTEEVGQLADEPVVANQSIYGPGGDGPDTDALEAAAAAAAAVDGDAVDVRAGEENKSEGKRVFERTKGGGRGDGGGRGSKGLTEYKQWSREGYDKVSEQDRLYSYCNYRGNGGSLWVYGFNWRHRPCYIHLPPTPCVTYCIVPTAFLGVVREP